MAFKPFNSGSSEFNIYDISKYYTVFQNHYLIIKRHNKPYRSYLVFIDVKTQNILFYNNLILFQNSFIINIMQKVVNNEIFENHYLEFGFDNYILIENKDKYCVKIAYVEPFLVEYEFSKNEMIIFLNSLL